MPGTPKRKKGGILKSVGNFAKLGLRKKSSISAADIERNLLNQQIESLKAFIGEYKKKDGSIDYSKNKKEDTIGAALSSLGKLYEKAGDNTEAEVYFLMAGSVQNKFASAENLARAANIYMAKIKEHPLFQAKEKAIDCFNAAAKKETDSSKKEIYSKEAEELKSTLGVTHRDNGGKNKRTKALEAAAAALKKLNAVGSRISLAKESNFTPVRVTVTKSPAAASKTPASKHSTPTHTPVRVRAEESPASTGKITGRSSARVNRLQNDTKITTPISNKKTLDVKAKTPTSAANTGHKSKLTSPFTPATRSRIADMATDVFKASGSSPDTKTPGPVMSLRSNTPAPTKQTPTPKTPGAVSAGDSSVATRKRKTGSDNNYIGTPSGYIANKEKGNNAEFDANTPRTGTRKSSRLSTDSSSTPRDRLYNPTLTPFSQYQGLPRTYHGK